MLSRTNNTNITLVLTLNREFTMLRICVDNDRLQDRDHKLPNFLNIEQLRSTLDSIDLDLWNNVESVTFHYPMTSIFQCRLLCLTLEKLLQQFPPLKSLEFAPDLEFAPYLKDHKNKEEKAVGLVPFLNVPSAGILSHYLVSTISLTELNLNVSVPAYYLMCLKNGLANNQTLKIFRLNHVDRVYDRTPATVLATFLKNNLTLETFHLGGDENPEYYGDEMAFLTVKDWEIIADALASRPFPLKKFLAIGCFQTEEVSPHSWDDPNSNSRKPSDILSVADHQRLAPLLTKILNHCESVNMSIGQLGDTAEEGIGNGLIHNTVLNQLILKTNNFTGKKIAAALQHNTSLTEIDLSMDGLPYDYLVKQLKYPGMRALVDACRRHRSLHYVYFSLTESLAGPSQLDHLAQMEVLADEVLSTNKNLLALGPFDKKEIQEKLDNNKRQQIALRVNWGRIALVFAFIRVVRSSQGNAPQKSFMPLISAIETLVTPLPGAMADENRGSPTINLNHFYHSRFFKAHSQPCANVDKPLHLCTPSSPHSIGHPG